MTPDEMTQRLGFIRYLIRDLMADLRTGGHAPAVDLVHAAALEELRNARQAIDDIAGMLRDILDDDEVRAHE
ncbi:MAG: hypothetical protein R3C14_28680 [Caldilineaceae bacterium]